MLASENIGETITAMRHDVINTVIDTYIPHDSMEEQWDVEGAEKAIDAEFGSRLPLREWLDADKALDEKGLRDKVCAEADAAYADQGGVVGAEVLRHFEKAVMLQSMDTHWREHLAALDHLRQGIHLRGYAQKNPKQEYKREAFELFSAMLDAIKIEVTRITTTVQVRTEEDVQAVEQQEGPANVQYQHADPDVALAQAAMPAATATPQSGVPKVGRNEPCPCGSGKKYKHCHGRLA